MIPEYLTAARARLAQDIREWCRTQAELWRQVPYWSLEADGRSGWSANLRWAYERGFWTVLESDLYRVVVDCVTGELCHKHTAQLTFIPDDVVLVLKPEHLDAVRILEGLKAQRLHEFRSDAASNATVRQRRLLELGLAEGQPYQRQSTAA